MSDCNNLAVANSASVMQETSSPKTQMSAQLCHKKRQGDQATVFTSFIMVSTLLNPIFNDICKHVTVINKEEEWVLGINT